MDMCGQATELTPDGLSYEEVLMLTEPTPNGRAGTSKGSLDKAD